MGQPMGGLKTSPRVGLPSYSKERKKGEGEEPKNGLPLPSPPAGLLEAWNRNSGNGLPKAQGMSPNRTAAARARLKERPLAEWGNIIAKIAASKFCCGENDRRWVATFDWLLKPDTALKVLEGKYDDRIDKATAHLYS